MVRRLYAFLLGIALFLPVMLGPAAGPLVRALGALEEHHCACGMTAGKCGCKECDLLERRQKAEEEMLRGQPLVRSSCDDGSVVARASFAQATLPPSVVVIAAPAELVVSVVPPVIDSRVRPSPPTPPPRHEADSPPRIV